MKGGYESVRKNSPIHITLTDGRSGRSTREVHSDMGLELTRRTRDCEIKTILTIAINKESLAN